MQINNPSFLIMGGIIMIIVLLDAFLYLGWMAKKLHDAKIHTTEYQDKLAMLLMIGCVLGVIKHTLNALHPNLLIEYVIECVEDLCLGYCTWIYALKFSKKLKDKKNEV